MNIFTSKHNATFFIIANNSGFIVFVSLSFPFTDISFRNFRTYKGEFQLVPRRAAAIVESVFIFLQDCLSLFLEFPFFSLTFFYLISPSRLFKFTIFFSLLFLVQLFFLRSPSLNYGRRLAFSPFLVFLFRRSI